MAARKKQPPPHWPRFEFELLRDGAGNAAVLCAFEFLGTADAQAGGVKVTPPLTVSHARSQALRQAAVAAALAARGAPGCVQVLLAADPRTDAPVVVKTTVRAGRGAAMAARVTGLPVTTMAALLAEGRSLDRVAADVGDAGAVCLEPALDHVIVSMARGRSADSGDAVESGAAAERGADVEAAAERRKGAADDAGEVIGVGRSFKEAFLKAARSREPGAQPKLPSSLEPTLKALAEPGPGRCDLVLHALRMGADPEQVGALSGLAPFFVAELNDIAVLEHEVSRAGALGQGILSRMKRYGFSDERLGALCGRTAREVRALRRQHGITAVFKAIEPSAGELPIQSACFYSTYEDENEAVPGEGRRVLILGCGPNPTERGSDLDGRCLQAARAVRRAGDMAVMVACDPYAKSAGEEVSDRLYLEPLTPEHVLTIIENEQPAAAMVFSGGQTAARLAAALAEAGVPILDAPYGGAV